MSASGNSTPLVSVVILYYRRPETIGPVLASVAAQDYGCREVVLVDNNSGDGIREVVEKHDAGIRLIELPENVGACAGRNAGLRAARGEIIVFIDDDVSFDAPDTLRKIVQTFQTRRDMHVLALQIVDPHTGTVRIREWCHTRPYAEFVNREFETIWFGEGASAFRREVFERCGGYYEPLYYGAEGHDMVLRILEGGFRILHTPEIRVQHWASEKGRTVGRQFYYFTRNFIWMAYKDYRPAAGLRFLVPKLLMMAYFAWRSRGYRPVWEGIRDGVKGLPQVRPHRTPASRATLRLVAEHERWRPGILARLARHKAAPQI